MSKDRTPCAHLLLCACVGFLLLFLLPLTFAEPKTCPKVGMEVGKASSGVSQTFYTNCHREKKPPMSSPSATKMINIKFHSEASVVISKVLQNGHLNSKMIMTKATFYRRARDKDFVVVHKHSRLGKKESKKTVSC